MDIIIEEAEGIVDDARIAVRLGLGEDHLNYSEIMAKPDIDLNPEQLSIKYQHCIWCKEEFSGDRSNPALCTSRNGHQCWVHKNCSITK